MIADTSDLLILGGGASGLAAAIEAAHTGGVSVAVLEKLDRVGKKILVTGNGRCNLLHLHASPADYNDPAFVSRVFAQYDVQSDLDFFRSLGLLTTADSEGRVYPHSLAASSVLDVLRLECRRLGVRLLCGEKAETLEKTDEGFLVNGRYRAKCVIVACGGQAASVHGSDGSGYALLRSAGHTVTPLRPALVQLRTPADFVRPLKGLRTPAHLTLHAANGQTHTADGELLFTDYGLSGIAAMELSRFASDGAQIQIDFLPQYDASQILSVLRRTRDTDGERPAEQLLTGVVHSRIGLALLRQTVSQKLSAPCRTLTDAQLSAVVGALKGFTLPLFGTKGFADAQVTAGGADVSAFSDTLESSLMPGLFACGEILDIDGKCGGYNLTFAWSSGRLAGFSAAQKILQS